MSNNIQFDWLDLAFASKKKLKCLNAVFVSAPRHISNNRIKQLVKLYLPKTNIVFGIAAEDYISGFNNQEKFITLKPSYVLEIANKVLASSSPNKVYILKYSQKDLPNILAKNIFKKVLFINGSWKYSFHTLPEFYQLVKNNIKYELISPFYDEEEAKKYANKFKDTNTSDKLLDTKLQVVELAYKVAEDSFDTSGQCGVVIAKKNADKKYNMLLSSYNKVVPYNTYAWHFGSTREQNFAPPGDLNYYDTVHAEVMALVKAQKQKILLKDTSLFINILPCPTCAKMLSQTDIKELYYSVDHSDGYAVKLLELAGKKVGRLVV